MNEYPDVMCRKCQNENYCADSKSAYDSCIRNGREMYSPLTNGDCFRRWSNEEICDFTVGIAEGIWKLAFQEDMPEDQKAKMKEEYTEWLAQEAKE